MPESSRTIRLLFREKSTSRNAFKVFTNVRVPGARRPRQIHLGYVIATRESISDGDKQKVLRRLRAKWVELFRRDDVDVDWLDAETKFSRLQGAGKTS